MRKTGQKFQVEKAGTEKKVQIEVTEVEGAGPPDDHELQQAIEFLTMSKQQSEEDTGPAEPFWKNKAYYALPENVRNAIDIAKEKSAHSEFWHKLENLNDKLSIFKMLFYTKVPRHQ